MLLPTLSLLAVSAAPPAGTYVLDAERTMLLVQLRPDESRILSGLSHRHVVRATRPTGSVRYDPARPGSCAIDVRARVADLQVDAPEMRKKVGYDDVLDDDDREDVKENMLDKDQLYAKKYPNISFVADRCEPMVDGRIQVQGKLTVRGVAHPLVLPMSVAHRGRTIAARAQFTLTHAVFGFEPYSTALGALANDDWLKFTIEIIARRKRPRPRPVTTTTTAPSVVGNDD